MPARCAVPRPAGEDRRTVEPAEDLPQYSSEDISRRGKNDSAFSAVLAQTEQVIGRKLNSNDMRVIFGVYDYLGIPAEVIVMLLTYCAEQYQERYGSSRRPSAQAIERLAYEWARQEIRTLEQAEAYVAAQKERRGLLNRIKGLLNIYERELSATEEKYITSWLQMGFREDAIAIAYDRTLTQKNALKWPYMNKILLNWHTMGLHTPREIEETDSRRPAKKPKAAEEIKPVDMDELRKIIDKI